MDVRQSPNGCCRFPISRRNNLDVSDVADENVSWKYPNRRNIQILEYKFDFLIDVFRTIARMSDEEADEGRRSYRGIGILFIMEINRGR